MFSSGLFEIVENWRDGIIRANLRLFNSYYYWLWNFGRSLRGANQPINITLELIRVAGRNRERQLNELVHEAPSQRHGTFISGELQANILVCLFERSGDHLRVHADNEHAPIGVTCQQHTDAFHDTGDLAWSAAIQVINEDDNGFVGTRGIVLITARWGRLGYHGKYSPQVCMNLMKLTYGFSIIWHPDVVGEAESGWFLASFAATQEITGRHTYPKE
ncbi:hypothetical protein D3C87_1438930 [compost metagenome]